MNIINLKSEGIYYLNEQGHESFVNFKECNQNWLAYRKKTEGLSDEQISVISLRDKTVGQRNSDTEFVIEFFAKPFIIFKFKKPEEEEQYCQLRDSIWKFGWGTLDWS